MLILLLFGCEKVIDVDLNDAHPQVVVEANISKFPFMAEVKLSKTGNYFGEGESEKIKNANVVVKSSQGESFRFTETEKGVYKSTEIEPTENITYNLTIKTENEIYESESTLNPAIPIDSLNYFFDKGFAFFDKGYIVRLYFADPVNTRNFYRIKIYENDILHDNPKSFIVFDDRLIDGKQIKVTLRGNIFDVGDTISIQLISLDKRAYEYFNTFKELINVNAGSAAPANPTSNISNGALGFFSAWSADIKTVIIREKRKKTTY
jgi:hypothetical protein